jgi:hypothetical protein
MEIKTPDYYIYYDTTTATFHFQGALRFNTEEYAPIVQLMDEVIDLEPTLLKVNFRELKFLNSSGFTMMARFVAKVNANKQMEMTIQADRKNPWHQKSLNNYKRLMPRLQFEWE